MGKEILTSILSAGMGMLLSLQSLEPEINVRMLSRPDFRHCLETESFRFITIM